MFVAEEKAGSLTRDQAQSAHAKPCVAYATATTICLRAIFMAFAGPSRPVRQVRSGSKLPTIGRTDPAGYLDALKNTDLAIVEDVTKPKSRTVWCQNSTA